MLSEKVALVTGAGSGIGFGIARELAAKGAFVILAGRSGQAKAASEELNRQNFHTATVKMDIADRESVSAGVAGALMQYGRIDILVNNAGIAKLSRFEAFPDELRDRHIDINLKGTWNVTKAVLPCMLKNRWGRIINIASVTGPYVSDPGYTAYAMTKAGLVGFTKSLAVELAKDGITVNAICPGFILTPNVRRSAAATNPRNPNLVLESIAAGVPMGRLGAPEEVGKLAAFLAGEESSYITGTENVIDGGNLLPETNVMGIKKP
ncbi:glucose 1-dehydrogenase [Caproiciproducens sp. CPB-2]|uniref:glucose 1-dehydrogenase n=1 Tax=Caproiciproducens sp. CPB-2 TaxID=3030017 RepID=UPI0023DA7528|nr:glucose 1-dehydrogenase [Caproiciproducens sp. CPB-2]MDF1495248.1 SDR family oxidoreductase [Caproiciproducens sp. CPB-2]